MDRDAIVDNALELFIKQGYNSTTLADIASATDIEPENLAAAQPNNESIIFADDDDMLAAVVEELAEAAPTGDLVEALRAAHHAVLSRVIAGDGRCRYTGCSAWAWLR